MEEEFPTRIPIPITYQLFEDKTYLEILKEKEQELGRIEGLELLSLVQQEIESKKLRIMRLTLTLLEEAGVLTPLESYKILLKKLDWDSFWKYLKRSYGGEIERIKLTKKTKKILIEIHRTLFELKNLIDYYKDLSEKIELFKRKGEIIRKLREMLELYPKHLRMGFLDEIETQALRYITDSYFTLFGYSFLSGDLKYMELANFLVLPLIINLQETSLSKQAFFLRLVHGSPVVPQMQVPEEVLKEEEKAKTLKGLLGLIKKDVQTTEEKTEE